MMLASHTAGLAFSSGTGLGLCHAIAHPVSAHTGTVHGVALTAVLTEVMEFNLPTSSEKLALAARSLEVTDSSASEEENARAAISAIDVLAQNVVGGMTYALGVTGELLPRVVEDTLSDLVIGNTPRMPSAEDVREILASAS